MKTLIAIVTALITVISLSAQDLKPYIIGFESTESISQLKEKLVSNLEANAIEVVGQYQPANDKNRWVIIYTCKDLAEAVEQIGDLTGFALTQRIAITKEEEKTIVSFTNPVYWGNAYFRDDYDKVSSKYTRLEVKLKKSMSALASYSGKQFGSEDGVELEDLRKYKYMFGMPEFDDTIEFGEFNSHKDAIARIEANLKNGVSDVEQVYKVELAGKDMVLYGFALGGINGESKFLPIIDISDPKHTASLPYEVFVKNNEVHMLHGRFRLALSFPDLTMGTFTKIMSSPGEIEELLEQIVK